MSEDVVVVTRGGGGIGRAVDGAFRARECRVGASTVATPAAALGRRG